MVTGIDSAVHYLSRVTAQYYFRRKLTPSFTTESMTDSLAKLFPDISDANIKTALGKIYKEVRTLLQNEKKRDSMIELALLQSIFVNIWDVGVNRCLYEFLPVVAGHCEHLLLINVIDLERDVPCLDEPPLLLSETYKKRGDDKLVMRLYGRMEYFMLLAGLKRWFNKNPTNLMAPEVIVVGTYTKDLAAKNGVEELKRKLRSHLTAMATQFEIENVIDTTILTYCIDGDKKLREKELSILKYTTEKMISSQPNFEQPFDPKWMFLRSLFYNPNSLAVSLEDVAKVARSCKIPSQDRLHQCLLAFRNVGSLLYNPEMKCNIAQTYALIDIPRVLEHLDRLFYLSHYQSTGAVVLTHEEQESMGWYWYGLINKTLADKVFTRQDSTICLEYLTCCKVCTEVRIGDETMYYLPSLRKEYCVSPPHTTSLYVQYHSHYTQCDQLVLFHKYLPKFFLQSDEVDFVPREEFNVTCFKYTTPDGVVVTIEVIYHAHVIEIYVSCGDQSVGVLNMALCSKLLELCKEVYDDVCLDVQNLRYDFSVMCANSEQDGEPHFVNFHVNYNMHELYCKTCDGMIPFSDDRSHWLVS